MVAGQPLRKKKNKLLASAYRHRFSNCENVPLDVGCIHIQANGTGIRYVLWLRHRALLCEELRADENQRTDDERDCFFGHLTLLWSYWIMSNLFPHINFLSI